MFQLCMTPFAPQDGDVDILSIEGAIEDQLSHVSAPCRDTLFDCLGRCSTRWWWVGGVCC